MAARAIGAALATYLVTTTLVVTAGLLTGSWRSALPWALIVALVVVSVLPFRTAGRAVVATVIVLAVSVPVARFAFGYVTGRESGVDRLAGAWSGSAGALTLTVDRVKVTAHFTRVDMTARNTGGDVLRLPVYANCRLIAGRSERAADTLASRWPAEVPPGGAVSGVLVFRAPLPGGVATATVSFATVLGSASVTGPVAVREFPLRPA